MSSTRHPSRPKVATSKRITYALAGAGFAVMALPLVTSVLPGEAGAARVPAQEATTSTSIGIVTVLPTESTVAKTTLAALSGTVQTFNPGTTTYTVGTGICTVEVIVMGAAGGTMDDKVGGRGSAVKGQFSVAAGEKFDITVGAYRAAGGGGLPQLGGGGSSKIVKQSNSALVVEAGGGGGDGYITLTEVNKSLNTIPNQTPTSVGATYAPFIKVNAAVTKGADASGSTVPTPVTATVQVPVGDYTATPTSTTLFTQSASAGANGAATDNATGILVQEIAPSTTVQLASVRVDAYAGGAGAGGSANKGGADADGGAIPSSTNLYPTTTVVGGPAPDPSVPTTLNFNAPYAVGAALGGSGGLNTIGNGFFKTGESVNPDKDGKVTVREIACSSGSSTLPPLGGGQGASGPLLPAALALLGAGAGIFVVRRRGRTIPVENA